MHSREMSADDGIVPPLDELKHRPASLLLRMEAATIQQLALQAWRKCSRREHFRHARHSPPPNNSKEPLRMLRDQPGRPGSGFSAILALADRAAHLEAVRRHDTGFHE